MAGTRAAATHTAAAMTSTLTIIRPTMEAFSTSRTVASRSALQGCRELRVVEPRVGAVDPEQCPVRALLDDGAVLHHQDQVGVTDRREPVRDDEGGPVRAKR